MSYAAFTRSSTAYTLEGIQLAINQPRYEAAKFGLSYTRIDGHS